MRFLSAICLLSLMLAGAVRADDAASSTRPFNFAVYWENDGTFIKPDHPTDRHYTNGLGLSIAWQPQWAQDLVGKLPPLGLDTRNARGAAGVVAGHLIFTPEDLTKVTRIRNDQPYVGYLFAGGFWQRADQDTLDHLQLDLGEVGPSANGKEVQNGIHHWRSIDEAQGWDNQIHDEFTFQLYARRKWRLNLIDAADSAFKVQLIPEIGAALGTVYRHVETNALLRLGWNLPDDFGPARLADVAAATTSGHPRGWGFYGFGRIGGRAVEHNLFVDGNAFRNSPRRDSTAFVGELQGGAAIEYNWARCSIEIVYSQTIVSEQFDGQHGPDAFGALTISGTIWY